MVSKELEFRGIPLSYLETYFEELGAGKRTSTFPFLFEKDKWKAEILNENKISFTANIKVNSVQIRFTAENEETLEQLLKNYRLKTMRAGG